MAKMTTKLRVLSHASILSSVLGMTACSASVPTASTTPYKGKNSENLGGTTDPGSGVESGIVVGEIATNVPTLPTSPTNGTKIDDEKISPPVPQTGGNGDGEDKDKAQTVKDGYYFIKAAGSLKCLSIPGNSKNSDVQLEQRDCDKTSENQKFELEFLNSMKAYYITNKVSGKVLEVRDQNEVVQSPIQQGSNNGGKYQMFNFDELDGKFSIKTNSKGLFINVVGDSSVNGALIQLWHEGSIRSSTWILEPTM